jgi:hypothetical protein
MHLLSILRLLVNRTSFPLSPKREIERERERDDSESKRQHTVPFCQCILLSLLVVQATTKLLDVLLDIFILRLESIPSGHG